MPITYDPVAGIFTGLPTRHHKPRHLDPTPRPRCTCPPTAIRPNGNHVQLCAVTVERRQRLHLTEE